MKPEEVTAIILCGGGGRRLGGVYKPLVRIGERALVEFVVERLRPQASRIVLSLGAGQDADAYQGFGCELLMDAEADQGPLGGLVSCFAAIPGGWFLTCPADAPRTAPDLARALTRDALARGVAVAHDGVRRHNLTMLIRRDRADSLSRFFNAGGRAVHRWLEAEAIPATYLSALASSFVNINTPADLDNFRRSMQAEKGHIQLGSCARLRGA